MLKKSSSLYLVLVCAFLSACGTKTTETDVLSDYYDSNYITTEESRYADYNVVISDDGSVLTTPEEKAFYSKGEIDKNLSRAELEIVSVYYKDYLHRSKKTINRFMYRALPYLAYTRDVFRSRGLPEELAFLAFIESGYNPWAVSRSNAVGMWQFMAPTGRHCGLIQDWWMDERRDPYKATHAAADYLTELYNTFHDWHLAIAAYNAGPGKIGRALKVTEATNFFELIEQNHKLSGSLRLKEETIQYVPRYLAMTKIMRNFAMLGFEPEEHTFSDNKPVITMPAVEIMAKPGTDLASIAKELGMDWLWFSAYNPAYNRYITPPDRETPFYVPYIYHEKAIIASKSNKNIGWTQYKIVRGDTLSKISSKVGVPVSVLRQLNVRSEPLQIGSYLRVPGRAGTVNNYVAESSNARMEDKIYRVRRGDTFSDIAQKHGLSIPELKAANPKITDIRRLDLGQTIHIPSSNTVAQRQAQERNTPRETLNREHTSANGQSNIAESRQTSQKQEAQKQITQEKRNEQITQKQETRPQTPPPVTQTSQKQTETKHTGALPEFHTVKSGDTFYAISRKYDININTLRSLNPQTNPSGLKLGEIIRLHERKDFTIYLVQRGDTFSKIAREHGLSMAQLQNANQDIHSITSLSLGQKIRVHQGGRQHVTGNNHSSRPPVQASPVATSIYTVKQGDSFHGIARKHGLTQEELALANAQIVSRSQIHIGQTINIPTRAFLDQATQKLNRKTQNYTVKQGDTYWSISQTHGMTTNELLQLNKLKASHTLAIGTKLKVFAR